MIKVWSELPIARTREQIADVATLIWVVFWGSIVWQLFQFLIEFAGVGRVVHDGGENMIDAGRSLGDSLAGIPLIGGGVRDLTSGAFAVGASRSRRWARSSSSSSRSSRWPWRCCSRW